VKKVMVENIGVWAGFGFPHLPIWAALCSLLRRHALACLASGLGGFSWFHDWHWPQLYDANIHDLAPTYATLVFFRV
jgi:hypothetical protein